MHARLNNKVINSFGADAFAPHELEYVCLWLQISLAGDSIDVENEEDVVVVDQLLDLSSSTSSGMKMNDDNKSNTTLASIPRMELEQDLSFLGFILTPST